MIKKINFIKDFAIFKEFNWNSDVRNPGNNIEEFKKLNIIYGRNYSGKTTLSRILRSFEKKELHSKYKQAKFEINIDNNNLNQDNLTQISTEIRVYNKDFVDDNLSFLKNEQDEIVPFAVLGGKNIAIEKKINNKISELGSIEKKAGLKYEESIIKTKLEDKKQEYTTVNNKLDEKLRNKANQDIKENSLYGDVRYNIAKIKTDIEHIKNNNLSLLNDKEIENKKKLIGEKPKNDINLLNEIKFNIKTLTQQVNDLLIKKIKPSKSIQELINDATLQEWVRKGLSYHKDKRTECAFCGGKLNSELWEKLDAHFSKESEELRNNINNLIKTTEQSKINNDFIKLNKNNFYTTYQDKVEEYLNDLNKEIKSYNETLDNYIVNLKKRLGNIFESITNIEIKKDFSEINKLIIKLNNIIKENNNKKELLENEQKSSKNDLKLNEIKKFINEIDYDNEINKIDNLNINIQNKEKELNEITGKIQQIEKEIEKLKISQTDEKKGAEKVNEYLSHFFGDDSIKFHANKDDDSKIFKFQILRNKKIAYNLSDGERSLIAFCYFMAKLHDTKSKDKELIIWIDDPISSLDNNHVFFVFSLIESVLTKTKNYKQLFISTHNIDFLKYLKRLTKPYIKIEENGEQKKHEDINYFLIERYKDNSKIVLMPKYLKKYVTEFNYLFHQIFMCADNSNIAKHEIYYNFGNNLRKFLEAYLFYKYPSQDSNENKLNLFFNNDKSSIAVANRVSNELSHLEEIFDRSMKPIDIPEISKLAKYVLKKIREKDPEQYNALLKSIGEGEN